MRYSLIALCVLLPAIPANARLGETFEQCKARYGEANPVDFVANIPAYKFKKGDFTLLIGFVNNIEVMCQIKKNMGKMTPEEVEIFVAAESDSGAFEVVKPGDEWKRIKPDGAMLHYDITTDSFTAASQAFDDALKEFNLAYKNRNKGF